MSDFYQHRPYGGGPIAKKPRMGPRPPHMGNPNKPHQEEDGKRLLSFKEFILNQSNDITEKEALTRYSDYKTEYMRGQIDKFFKAHQEEEWFRNKYRPIELKRIEESIKESKIRRKALYEQIVQRQNIDNLSITYDNAENLSKFLENFSYLLEGATLEEIESNEAAEKYSVSSIYLPNLHPSIDKAIIEEYAASHPGYLRVALSDAQPTNGWRRRAWVTYKQMDNESIKKLCWEFNANKFNGQETKAIVNKDLSHRVRYAQHMFNHIMVAKSDLKNVAKLLTYFDGEDCPMLETIKDYLIEETNEEERLLGLNEPPTDESEPEQDPKILQALDKVLIYLRVVHSFDYYALTEYSGEDDMPQRVGIMFARPKMPSTSNFTMEILKEFNDAQRSRTDSFIEKPALSDIELNKLGRKEPEREIENFIYQHTFEKKPGEKYVCRLTKKKFTAPEFVRKHILTRCQDKLDEVRTEVEFLNNYIADPRRPM